MTEHEIYDDELISLIRDGAVPAEEKLAYSAFRLSKTIFRRGFIPNKLVSYDDMQLPNNSVLHSIDKFLTPSEQSITLNLSTPVVHNERFQKFVRDVMVIPPKDVVPFGVNEKYRLNTSRFSRELQSFYISNRGKIFRLANEVSALPRSTILPIINYNPILHTVLTGSFVDYRRFEVVLRTMLQKVVDINEIFPKFHYMHFDVSPTVYKRSQFIQPMNRIAYQTVKVRNDWSYYLMIHLLSFVVPDSTTSLFSKLTQAQLDVTNIILTVGNRAIVYNLGDLKHMVDGPNFFDFVLRHINTLKLTNSVGYDLTSVDDEEFEKIVDEQSVDVPEPDDTVTDNSTDGDTVDVTKPSVPASVEPQQKQLVPLGATKLEKTVIEPAGIVRDKRLDRNTILLMVQAAFNTQERNHIYVDCGASMVIHGLRPFTSDIDIWVDDNMAFVDMAERRKLDILETDSGVGSRITINTYIDVFSPSKESRDRIGACTQPFDIISGFRYASLELLEKWYLYAVKIFNRPKDHENLAIVQKALASQLSSNDETNTPTQKVIAGRASSPITGRIDEAAEHIIANASHLTPTQKERVRKVAALYRSVEIGGKTVGELLESTPDPKIDDNKLSHLESMLVDKSMMTSSVIDIDRLYITQMHDRDLAAVAASFAVNGMFLVDHEEHTEIDQLNRIIHHKFVYEDVNGKRHRIHLRLPIVSPDGTFLVGGTTYRMTKQQVNLPICKIDANRVSLASNFNKTLVERISTKAHSFASYITRYINDVYNNRDRTGLFVAYGKFSTSSLRLPYDYTCIASRYSKLIFSDTTLIFDYENRFSIIKKDKIGDIEVLKEAEKELGVFCGFDKNGYLMFTNDNRIKGVTVTPDKQLGTFRGPSFPITTLLFSTFGDIVPPPKPITEWTELKIQDKNFPLAFILGSQRGLLTTFNHIGLEYKVIPKGERFERRYTTIAIPFSDCTVVFDRYPLEKSLVACGLLKYQTKTYTLESFNTSDIYYTVLQDNGLPMNYLKGIKSFFDLFIDPITHDVLLKMGEPTTVGDLLLRANQMLSTEDSIPAASMRNHRLRGYERFNSVIYNEMSRQLASYNVQRGSRKTFSVNPDAVFLRIVQDQSVGTVDEINPIQDIKNRCSATYSGMGGRTAQSFVVDDRRYPDDAVGILSECTPDSGKVAINTYTSADPVIANIRGMFDVDSVNLDTIQPTQLLSSTSLLMPCATNDD